jgi:glucose-1-phosphate thymidylyltransferase
MAWLDTGTHESLYDASSFIETVEKRQGLKIACPEEIAYRMGYIDAEQVRRLAGTLAGSSYGNYLLRMLDQPSIAVADHRVRESRTSNF